MASCVDNICGVGGISTPPLTAPSDGYAIYAESAFGGIKVWWEYPAINPGSVRHFQLFRSTSATAPSKAYQIVNGSYFFDAFPDDKAVTYYYWIKVVSYDGFVGKLIGPAHAITGLSIQGVMNYLANDIRTSPIGMALAREIDSIVGENRENYKLFLEKQAANYASVKTYVSKTDKANETAIAQIATVQEELADANGALIESQTNMAAALASAIAAVHHTSAVKIGYAAFDQVKKIWDDGKRAWVTSPDSAIERVPYSGDGTTNIYNPIISAYELDANWLLIKSLIAKYGPTSQSKESITTILDTRVSTSIAEQYYRIQAYKQNRTLIIDAIGVDQWNSLILDPTSPILSNNRAKKLTWYVGLPLAEVVTQSQVNYKGTDGTDQTMKMEEAFRTQVDVNDRLMGQYHVKIQSGTGENNRPPMIAGFGLAQYSKLSEKGTFTDTQSTFLVNANTFAIGAPTTGDIGLPEDFNPKDPNTAMPFVVQTTKKTLSDGREILPGVYINTAMIRELTFSQITSDDSHFTHSGGKTFAKDLTVEGLHVGRPDAPERMEVTNEVIRIFHNNQERVRIGNLSI